MEKSSVDVVRAAVDSYLERGIDGFVEYFAPDVVLDLVQEAPTRGVDDARASLGRWEDDWEGLETIPEEFLDVGDRVLVTVLFRGRGRASGVRVEGRYFELLTVHDGRIVSWQEFDDRSQALAAARIAG